MFGDLLKNLLQKQVQSSVQDKLGGTGASILSGLFGDRFGGGDFGDKFEMLSQNFESPLQNIFGNKWQNGQSEDDGFNFEDILKHLR